MERLFLRTGHEIQVRFKVHAANHQLNALVSSLLRETAQSVQWIPNKVQRNNPDYAMHGTAIVAA